jgi:hypothetical protein
MGANVNLWTLLHDTRRLHERLLKRSIGHRETRDTCAFAAYLLDTSIKRWLPELRSRIRGGDGANDGGFFDATGRGHGHYWVEIDDGSETWIACLTSDQFGEEPIVLLRAAEARGRYIPGNQALVDVHMEAFAEWLADAAPGT